MALLLVEELFFLAKHFCRGNVIKEKELEFDKTIKLNIVNLFSPMSFSASHKFVSLSPVTTLSSQMSFYPSSHSLTVLQCRSQAWICHSLSLSCGYLTRFKGSFFSFLFCSLKCKTYIFIIIIIIIYTTVLRVEI